MLASSGGSRIPMLRWPSLSARSHMTDEMVAEIDSEIINGMMITATIQGEV